MKEIYISVLQQPPCISQTDKNVNHLYLTAKVGVEICCG